MATPIVKTLSDFKTVQNGTPNSLVFLVQHPDGSDLDVSSGYTASIRIAGPSNPATKESGSAPADITGQFSLTMGNGLITADAPSSIALNAGSFPMQLAISNDSFATQAVPFMGTLNVNGNI